jgi:hypothetical protein
VNQSVSVFMVLLCQPRRQMEWMMLMG